MRLSTGTGQYILSKRTVISTDAASASIGHQLARYLEPATGITFRVQTTGPAPAGSISLRRDRTLTRLGDEGYLLDVACHAASPPVPMVRRVCFYALQTIRQLLPAEIFREATVGRHRVDDAGVSIEDYPRFAWRGMHLDVGRHFMPKEFVKKYIDLIALTR